MIDCTSGDLPIIQLISSLQGSISQKQMAALKGTLLISSREGAFKPSTGTVFQITNIPGRLLFTPLQKCTYTDTSIQGQGCYLQHEKFLEIWGQYLWKWEFREGFHLESVALYTPCSEADVFSKGSDLYSLENSCNSGLATLDSSLKAPHLTLGSQSESGLRCLVSKNAGVLNFR